VKLASDWIRSRHRTTYSDSSDCGHRQRSGLPQGSGVRSLGGVGSPRTLHWRQAEAARHQQARQLLFAEAIRAGCTCSSAVQRQAVIGSEDMAGPARIANTLQRRRRGAGKQAGTHGMGCARQGRSISTADSDCRDWSADGGCLTTALEIASRFPHPQTSYGYCEQGYDFLPGLLANHEMAQRSNPALFKPELGRSPSRLRN